MLQPRYSKRYPELLVYPDGRAYDTNQDKWLNLLHQHNCHYVGAVLYWGVYKKTYYIPAARLVYECFVLDGLLTKGWSITYINGDHKDLRPENLKKVPRNEVGIKDKEKDDTFSMWMGSDTIFM